MISYWERTALSAYDLVVIGGGIVGNFTALEYARAHPNAKIAVLERGFFPEGASTKNAGFACFGSIAELEHDLETLGAEQTIALVMRRYEGLQKLRNTLGDAAIGYEEVGGFEVCFNTPDLDRIAFFNDLLEPALGARPYSWISAEGFGFSPKAVGLIKNALEGTIHTGKMMDALQRKVSEAGIRYFTQSPVSSIEDGPNGKTVHIQSLHGTVALDAKQVALCTNAFTKDFLPELDLNPGRGMIVLTKPHPAFEWKGSFHYHDGYHYFRSIDGRLLSGGGRQLDLHGETTTEPGINATIEAQLLKDIQDFIAPGIPLEVEQKWSGVMAFGANKQPVVQRIDPHLVAGVRLGGMGVAIGASVGAAVADLLRS